MRFQEIKQALLEYEDLNQEKETIISKISGMSADNEQEAQLLDRIYKILNSGQISQNIDNAFDIPLADENMADKQKQQVRQDMTRIISSLDSDYKTMKALLDRLENKGSIVDIGALAKPLNTFGNVFGDTIGAAAFIALSNYGVGKNQKGPGEYAFASLSNKIRLAAGEGDLEIDGIGKVELKAAMSSSGGRIGYGGGSQKAKKNVIEKYAERIPSVMQSMQGKGGSVGLTSFMTALNQDLPVSDQENQSIRRALMQELLRMDMEAYANPVADLIATSEDISQIELEYLKQNFLWYKNRDDFDALLLVSIPNKKTAMIRNENDLQAFRTSGHSNALGISIVPTQAGAGREQWAQLTLNKAKI